MLLLKRFALGGKKIMNKRIYSKKVGKEIQINKSYLKFSVF